MSVRHDPRADPDEPTTSRIDVVELVEIDRGAPSEVLTSAASNFRRELTRLQQQAAAVERTLDEHRRERSDSIEKLQRAAENAAELEGLLSKTEAELLALRKIHEVTLEELHAAHAEREDLQRAIEAAKASLEDLRRIQEESEALREARDQAQSSLELKNAELAQSRDAEAALKTENERAHEETKAARDAASKARDEAKAARDAAAKARTAADREREAADETIAELQREAASLRAKLQASEEKASREESRANAAEQARAAVEDGVRNLREEINDIAAKFARLDLSAALERNGIPRLSDAPPGLDDGWASIRPPASARSQPSSVPPFSRVPTSPPVEVQLSPPAARDDLLAMLSGDPGLARVAVDALRQQADTLRGVPPRELVDALAKLDYDAEAPVFELARIWEREPLCHALICAMKDQEDLRLREHGAWLLKHLGAPSAWKSISDIARSEREPIPLRRWLLETLDRLAASGAIGWRELGDTVTALSRHADATIRDGVVGILASLERGPDQQRLLLEFLRTDDDEGVLASAVHAIASALPIELDPAVVDRLLDHPSARVQRSVRDLIERAKQGDS